MAERDLYASRIFLNAALPLLAVLARDKPSVRSAFAGKSGVVQVSARADTEGIPAADGVPAKIGTHFVVEKGIPRCVPELHASPDLELEFPTVKALNAFFSGASKKLPRIRGGFKKPGLLVATFSGLLTMASFLGAKTPPKAASDRELLVKLFFYLLSSGISQLNKAGHPAVSKWAKTSPDRVYALSVLGEPELAAYVRVKAGNTKAVRGLYERSKPFFTLAFDSPRSALGTLLGEDEMLAATAAGKIVMQGAPEYGAQLGEFLLLVGSLAK